MARSVHQRIYDAVRRVPMGRVATYGQVASLAGLPGQARLVGYALHNLPDDSDVPWHRVISARGQISTPRHEYAAAAQHALLKEEGVVFDAQEKVNLSRYQWIGLDWPEIEALREEWNKNECEKGKLTFTGIY